MRDTDLPAKLQTELGDQYTLERELPRGGMSRVFVAIENALGRNVVLKVLSSELAANLSAERFKREIAMAARLQHPHIVPLFSAGQAGSHLYYTMPLVDGESLRDRINAERPMAIANVNRILEEVASALGYAHSQGMIHRDIKPENVMFFHGRAVVLDFGIGKALTAAIQTKDGAPQFVTTAGMKLGTPMYMAPEQAAGDPALDHRADLYALGVVAYEMITGHPPFSGSSVQAIYTAHAKLPAEPIAKRRPNMPPKLAALVMQLLEKDPGKRPQKGEEVVKAIVTEERRQRGSLGGMPALLRQVPPWVPWAIAAVSTVTALVLSILAARAK